MGSGAGKLFEHKHQSLLTVQYVFVQFILYILEGFVK